MPYKYRKPPVFSQDLPIASSLDGRVVGYMCPSTPKGYVRAFVQYPQRRETKLFRYKYSSNDSAARDWIVEKISRYWEYGKGLI